MCICLDVCLNTVPARVLHLQDLSTPLSFGRVLGSVAWLEVSDHQPPCVCFTSALFWRIRCSHLSVKPWCGHKTFVTAHRSQGSPSFTDGVLSQMAPSRFHFLYEQQLTLSLNRRNCDLVHCFQLQRLNGAFQQNTKWQVSNFQNVCNPRSVTDKH